MVSVNDMVQLQGWFKTSYSDKMEDLTPDHVYYVREAKPLSSELQPGGVYSTPVTLTGEQGVTKASSSAGAFSLNPPVAMASRLTSIEGSQLVLRAALDYETVFRSKNKNAFISATKGVVGNMAKSAYFYQETDFMWGQTGVSTVAALPGGLVITLTTAQFAPGLWLGSENRSLRIESTAGVLRGLCTVTSYDIEARTITVDAIPPATVVSDVIFFAADGPSGINSMVGLFSAINTTTGVLWGINRSTYSLWRAATSYSALNAPLSFNKVMKAITRASNHGLGDDISDIEVVCNPGGWTDLGNDLAALRAMDSSYKTEEAANGSEKIVFHCPAGKVSIVSHKMMKEGYAFVHPAASRCMELVGAAPKPTFELPGMVSGGEKQYLRPMENNAGIETRCYWNAAAFSTKVHQMILIDHIVNSI